MPKHAPAVTPQQALSIAQLWEPGAHDVRHVRSGENSVWRFEAGVERILRVTSETHRTRELLNGELAFVDHLTVQGANVARSIESNSTEKVVDVSRIVGGDRSTYATVFERLEGRHFEFYSDDIDRPLFEGWGRTMAQIHLMSEAYSPPDPQRPVWKDDDVAGCSLANAEVGDDHLVGIRNDLVAWLSETESESKHFGMVHGDFEKTNFVMKDGAIGVFDFDDCCQHWFCWDIVCALWVFRNAAKSDRSAFLGWFLDGYSRVREPDPVMLGRFSDLVRLRTIALILYRTRARDRSEVDEWTQRNLSWLKGPWEW
jgi:Ser/Thr protein kinase RdoA (MazF antagonist)